MNKKVRLNEVTLIRIFAILSVVVGHSIIVYTGWGWYTMPVPSGFLNELKKIIDIYQMPLFISLSGYLFYYLKIDCGKYTDFFLFLKSKFQRILVPFVIVGVFFMIPLRILGNYTAYEGKSLSNIILFDLIIGKDPGNLWFLPVLFIIFIIFFFYAKYIFKKNKYLILFHFIIFFMISLISYRIPNTFFISRAMYYAVFFFFGFHLFRFRNTLINRSTFILLISGILQFSNRIIQTSTLPSNIYSRAFTDSIILITSLSSCLFIYTLLIKISETTLFLSLIDKISFIDRNSFGLYLFHAPLIYPILNYFTKFKINPFLFSFLLFITITSISLILTELLSKSKYLKFIIGK